MSSAWRFRKMLPLVMTGVQLVLLALSIARTWHLPTNPGELHRKYPPTTPRLNRDEGEVVSFYPDPPVAQTTTVFKVATALSLPAMFCGVFIGIPLILIGVGSGEAWWIGISALLGIALWRQIGRWVDDQRTISLGVAPIRSKWQFAVQSLLRVVAFFILVVFVFSLTFVHHGRSPDTTFLSWAWIAWSGIYLLLSFWGGWRETRLARAKAAICTADGW